MDASAENQPKHGDGGRGKAPAAVHRKAAENEIHGKAAADDFLFADDTFPSLPDFPCLSSPSSTSTFSSSSSNSSSALPAGGADMAADDGLDALTDIDQLLDLASLSVPSMMIEDDPFFPDVSVMIDDDISEQQLPLPVARHCRADGAKVVPEGDQEGFASDDLPQFFMEWLTNNRDCISAEDLRSIRLRRSTIESAAARLGGGRHGTMQLLKLILTWVQNHHLQKKKRCRDDAMEEVNAAAPTSWMTPNQGFTPPAYGGEAIYSNMQTVGGGNMVWPQQYAPSTNVPYTAPPLSAVVPPQPFTAGFGSPRPAVCSQRMAGVEPSATKEARKKRMARQQQRNLSRIQAGSHMHHPQDQPSRRSATPPSGGCNTWGQWSSSPAPVVKQIQVQNPPSTKSNSSRPDTEQSKPSPVAPASVAQQHASSAATSNKRLQAGARADRRFLLQKVLKQSDVGSLGRIVLPKKEAETHLPDLKTRDGVNIPMEDIGTSRVWNMRYRFWPNNKSRMYLLENTGDFVRSNDLQEGDFIVIYCDVKSGKYLIRGVKVRPGKHKHGCSEKGAGVSDTKASAEDSAAAFLSLKATVAS